MAARTAIIDIKRTITRSPTTPFRKSVGDPDVVAGGGRGGDWSLAGGGGGGSIAANDKKGQSLPVFQHSRNELIHSPDTVSIYAR